MSRTFSFEDVFLFPESTIQSLLQYAKQPNRDFVTNRYVATVVIAEAGNLDVKDYYFARKPQFQELYLRDFPNHGYVNRFEILRNMLISECDAQRIKNAINKYEDPNDTPGAILSKMISELSGDMDTDYLRNMALYLNLVNENSSNVDIDDPNYDELLNEVMLNMAGDIQLVTLVEAALTLNNFERMQRELNNNSSWIYTKCILRVLQSDQRTRMTYRQETVRDPRSLRLMQNKVYDLVPDEMLFS